MKKNTFLYGKVPLTFSSQIPIGIELEFERARLSSIQKRLSIYDSSQDSFGHIWQAKKDSSVSKILPNDFCGGEAISPIFYNRSKDIHRLKRILQILKEEKALAGAYSSLQVSVDLSIFENNSIYFNNFLMLWSLFEAEIYRFSCSSKEHIRKSASSFALPLGNHLYYNNKEWMANGKNISFSSYLSYLQNILQGDGEAFYGIFLETEKNKNGRNRIEFRTCNATFEEGIVLNTINFFVHLILASKSSSLDESFIKPFYERELEPFLCPFPSSLSYSSYHDFILHAKENKKKASYLADILYHSYKEKDLFFKQYTKKM